MKKIIYVFTFFILGIVALNAQEKTNKIIVNTDLGEETINKNIYGHFAEHLGNCIYGGFWVGEESAIPNTRGIRNDVIEALKEIAPPVIRWPGGCFADYYHWKDGIGSRDKRPAMINSSWGGVTEDNSFGTHEFLDLCELLSAEPYLCINVGSGTVQEARDWVEYINSDNISPMTNLRKKNGREKPWNVKYWAVGNESWGCGGNMTPDYYADLYKRFSTFLMSGKLYRIASGGIDNDFNWTETILKKTQKYQHLIDGYSYHYYTVFPEWNNKGSATDFAEKEWFGTMQKTLAMESSLKTHIALMDEYDPKNNIGLIADEWGNWFNVEPETNPGFLYQQNTLRDAVTAALNLNIFNNHAKRVKMANIAQTINVLQAMLLTKDNQIVKTPTYYVFKMYKVHQNSTLLPLNISCEDYELDGIKLPGVSVSASKDAAGAVHISLANINPNKAVNIEIDLRGITSIADVKGEIITSPNMNDYNDFGISEKVNVSSFNDFDLNENNIEINVPSKSVITLEVK
ncbi:MAG: alpha-N-arabinofuranosidase [Melioribacteraceae bacterium]|nr:alpha-N-arabinofuranosidase [Melioribacteraceae bacterium]